MSDKKNTEIISSHSILIGLTPIIPIPFADDFAKNYFQERMVRKLAENYNYSLSSEDLKIITSEEHKGCLPGCLTSILFYPLKKLFRKIFFFLEWKRAIDTVSKFYHKGYLIDYALSKELLAPKGSYNITQLRNAIDQTCQEVGTNPIEKTVKATFDRSKETLKDITDSLWKNISQIGGKKGQPSKEEIEKAALNLESAEVKTGVNLELEKALIKIPKDYFEELEAKFMARLKAQP
jgi:hypothetical protein